MSESWENRGIFCALTFTCLVTTMIYSIQAPIFPFESEIRNASSTEYGLVFGAYEFTQMFSSPLLGSHAASIGVTRVFISGIVLTGLTTVSFGCLKFMSTWWSFIGWALVLRVLEAVGTSAIYVGVYTFVVNVFPETYATVAGALEIVVGFSMAAGPFLGSVLYQLGGFFLPFAVAGGLVFVTGVVVQISLKGRHGHNQRPLNESTTHGTFDLLKTYPSILIYMLIVVVAEINFTFLLTLLQSHLDQFNLTHVQIGLVFLLNGFSNFAAAPILSYLCTVISIPELVPLSGLFLFIGGYFLVGPMAFFTSQPSLWVTLGGVVLIGLGVGTSFSPGFILSIQAIGADGLQSSISSQVSGLWMSAIALGGFIGPITAGVLNDYFGFEWSTLSMIGLDLIQMIPVVYLILGKICEGISAYQAVDDRSLTDAEFAAILSKRRMSRALSIY